eukprot:Nitzschia sp. Nitz4//scaffold18_size181773//124165//125583//NITZ4_001931-RA/size181773-processed-gene-0.206-mRNA-1//1//CDS//3329540059//1530//frame0
MSSLTEDQAFVTGSSDIPIRTSSSFAANSFSTPRETLSSSRQSVMASPQPSSGSSSSGTPEPVKNTPSMPVQNLSSAPQKPSLRSAAGRVPKLNRQLGKGRMNQMTLQQRMEKVKAAEEKTRPTKTLPRKSSSSFLTLSSLIAVFAKFFKLLHKIIMLPEVLRQWLVRPRWTVAGKHVMISDASTGLGAEIARQYASQGAQLALFASGGEDLEGIARECREFGCMNVKYYSCDLANPVSTKLAMKQALVDFGRFDVAVLNAGRTQGCFFEEIKDPSQIENMIKLNINGAITSLHYVLPQMPKNRDSRIVVISDTAGIVAAPYQSVFSATKHALTGFSNSLRIELKNTYGQNSPRVCLVSLPEVSGNRIVNDRMDMGAKLPPTKWYSWAGIPLAQAVHDLLPAIAAGRREFGQPSRFNFWRSLYIYCPEWVDFWVMKHVQKTHYRPLEEKNQPNQGSTSLRAISRPHNRSWAH